MEVMRQSWTDDDAQLARVNDRMDVLHRTLIFTIIAMTTAILAGNAALVTLIVTKL